MMLHGSLLFLLIGFSTFTLGCAQIIVRQVKNESGSVGMEIKPGETSGVRFFRPALHVWITVAAPSEKVNIATQVKGTTEEKTDVSKIKTTSTDTTTSVVPITPNPSYSAKFETLPDYSQEYIIQWQAGFGSVKPAFDLDGGWNLTKFASEVDSKTAENLTAVSSLVTSAAGALTADPNFSGAGLYKMKVDSEGRWSLGQKVLSLE